MAYSSAPSAIYAKGTMDVWLFDPATFDLNYYSNKVQTNNLTTSVNTGTINGSLRNPVLLNLPDGASLELEITNATSTQEARRISIGGQLTYNGICPVLETITAESGELTVGHAPAAPYGASRAYAFIDKSGTAYTVDQSTGAVQNFTATIGQTYCVRYFTKLTSARQLKIGSIYDTPVEICMIRIPLYTVPKGSSSKYGTLWGDRYIWIPRLQATGETGVNGSQTDADAETLKFKALAYEEASRTGVCMDAESYSMAYMVDMPIEGPWALVEGLAVMGGGVRLSSYGSVKVPFVYIMKDGSLERVPNNEQLVDSPFTVTVTGDDADLVTVSQTSSYGTVITATDVVSEPIVLYATATKEVGMEEGAGLLNEDQIDTTSTEMVTDDEEAADTYIEWQYEEGYTEKDGSVLSISDDGNLEQTYDDGAGYSAADLELSDDGDLSATQTNNSPRYVSCTFTITVE